jgi:ADP-heptose:LPS heptosyltransferase
MTPNMAKDFKKIAIFRALQLGDLLCAIPAFRAIRAAYPTTKITLIGLPWAKAFVKRFNHYIDTFIEFPGYPGLPERDVQYTSILDIIKEIQSQQFDLAIQMHGSGTITNPLVQLFNAKQTAGYYLEGNYKPNNDLFFPYPKDTHEIHRWLELVENLDIPSQGDNLEFSIYEDEKKSYIALTNTHNLKPNTYAVIHPGARDPERRWDPIYFAKVADALAVQGLHIVLTGTRNESTLTVEVAKAMKSSAHDLAGKTDLGTMAALIKDAALLISNDTGVSHIAAAVKTPSIIIFLKTDPKHWAPLNKELHLPVKGHEESIDNIIGLTEKLIHAAGSATLHSLYESI